MSELLPTRKRFTSDKYASDKKDFFRSGDKSQQFFSDRALEKQIPVWGPQLQRAVQPEREGLQRSPQICNNYKKNKESVNQVNFLSSMSYKPREENIHVGGRMKHFLYNWEKLSKDQWVLETVKGLKLEFIQIPSVQTKLSNCHIIPNSERRDRIYVREKSHLRSKPTKVRNQLHKPHFFLVEKKGGGTDLS